MGLSNLLSPEVGFGSAAWVLTRGLGSVGGVEMSAIAFKSIRREMLYRAPELGRIIVPSSITGTTVVSTASIAETSIQKYVGYFIVRADAVTANAADRVRRITSQTAPSTLIHNQTAYVDTTGGSEVIELTQFEPYLYDAAIDVTLSRTRRLDRTNIPTLQNTSRYWIGDLDWIEQPSHIVTTTKGDSPVINRNRYFEKWNTYSSSGILMPDFWTLAGAGATMARSTTGNRRGLNTLAITRAGTDATLLQTVGLLENGVSRDSLRGKVITIVGVCQSAVASQVRLRATDGVNTVNSAYHTGGGTMEELSMTITVAAAATTLSFGFSIESSNTECQVDECYGYEMGSADSIRADSFNEHESSGSFDQGNGTLSLTLPVTGRGANYFVYSQRAYPRIYGSRLAAGTMDDDLVDAPIALIASGAIARLYEGLSGMPGQDGTRAAHRAADWNHRWETMASMHLGMPDTGRGLRFPTQRYAAPVR